MFLYTELRQNKIKAQIKTKSQALSQKIKNLKIKKIIINKDMSSQRTLNGKYNKRVQKTKESVRKLKEKTQTLKKENKILTKLLNQCIKTITQNLNISRFNNNVLSFNNLV